MTLLPIEPENSLIPEFHMPAMAWEALKETQRLYARVGFVPPWIGYIGIENGRAVGLCAFKSAPVDGRVEIAYFTFPEFEGKGYATQMAKELITIAKTAEPDMRITAQTLPQVNASTAVLTKAGFMKGDQIQHPEDGLVQEWILKT